ncbi:hypothetical protein PHYC_00783 [Phycisphaerales bacterium]|nr:hypothetical protein PHYC_00783 [Phycisphaerales bacterium]
MSKRLQVIVLFAALLAGFFALNMLAGRLLTGTRIDATQDSVFTLTKGSRNIARSPEEPVKLTYYFSSKLAQGRPELESYARRVRELLQEYARASNGKINLEIIDPEPFSEQEDKAAADGLVGVPVGSGENLFFGLVGTNSVETKEVVAFFDPRKERFLEYDTSRLLYSLANPKKKIVGLISGLPLEGGFTIDQRTRQPAQTPAWRIVDEIKGLFEIRSLSDPAEIPLEVDVLLVVHPKALTDRALYAIDQFVLRGGRLLAFMDPLCENDDSAGQFSFGAARGSNLTKLTDAWGVQMPPDKLAADDSIAMRVGVGDRGNPEVVPYVVWLGCGEKSLTKEDAVTGSLKQVIMGTAGFIQPKEGAKDPLTITPLIHTTPTAMMLPSEALSTPPDPKALLKSYTPGSTPLTLVARLSGKAKTAFPDGPPKPKEGEPAAEPPKATPLTESAGDVNIILVTDCDMLSDRMWVSVENFFGQQFARKISDNGDFTLSALDNLMGSADLIAIRARRESTRPFTVVEEMQRRAEKQNLAEQTVAQAKVDDLVAEINKLQAARDDKDARFVLTPEQEAKKEQLNKELAEARKRLREVQRKLRSDIETLGVQLKLLNTAAVPVAVAVFSLGLWFVRKSRRAAAAKPE